MAHATLCAASNKGTEFCFVPFLMFFRGKALRYLSIFTIITAVALVGCEKNEVPDPNTLNRTAAEIKQLDEKLSKVQPGDLLVRVDTKDNVPSVRLVIRTPEHRMTMEGMKVVMCSDQKYAVSTHGYDRFFKEQGDVYVVPKEKASAFYRKIKADARRSS